MGMEQWAELLAELWKIGKVPPGSARRLGGTTFAPIGKRCSANLAEPLVWFREVPPDGTSFSPIGAVADV